MSYYLILIKRREKRQHARTHIHLLLFYSSSRNTAWAVPCLELKPARRQYTWAVSYRNQFLVDHVMNLGPIISRSRDEPWTNEKIVKITSNDLRECKTQILEF